MNELNPSAGADGALASVGKEESRDLSAGADDILATMKLSRGGLSVDEDGILVSVALAESRDGEFGLSIDRSVDNEFW